MVSKDVIIGLLKDNSQGLSIEELASKSKLNRTTVRVILEGLIGEKVVIQRIVGNTKLNYWKFK